MRNPEIVLNTLCQHSKVSDSKFERLYRILFNKEMFCIAYQRIYAKPGNMIPGTDGQTIDQMSIGRIERIIETLRNESYKPNPAKRVYIPKKNGKKRPLGIPSVEDKLVQEVVRMILEAIYEGHFESTSHGFRPHKSCHTALTSIQRTFTGAKWFIEGDIKGFFDNIDHDVLVSIMRERIADERFLRLIRKFLKAGYIEDWKYNNTYSGTPQGGIISPILANIYLDKFDKYMKKYISRFDKGKERSYNKEYCCLNTKTVNLRKKWKAETDETVKAELLTKIKAMQEEKNKMPCRLPMDENYRRLKYVRYADDFLIGVIGSKADCEQIKADITEYMMSNLKLELSAEKTLITHAKENAKFLGFDITVRTLDVFKRNSKGIKKREFVGKVMLMLSSETVKQKLLSYDAVKFTNENGKDVWKPKSREKMVGMKPEDILAQFNLEIKGFYNYYCIANNVSSTCADFGYIMEYSLYMTLGQKLRRHVGQIRDKYRKGKNFGIPYKDAKGKERFRILYKEGFKRKSALTDDFLDRTPCTMYVPKPSLAERLKQQTCEMCGATDTNVVMHHIRTLVGLKGDTPWGKLMLSRHRKTLVVCESCYAKIQLNGK